MPRTAPGLEKTHQALQEANIALPKERVLLIAGTNGKGTTAKTLEQLLTHAQQNVGLFTSPHLITTCERLRTNNEMISEAEFVQLCRKHKDLIIQLELTHFESLTLFAVDYFYHKKCDWYIFEVGLGGTWDSTNAIPHQYSVITNIGHDHQHILGNTLAEIASNKFGIIQQNNTVISNQLTTQLANQLEETITKTNSKLTWVPTALTNIQQLQTTLRSPWGDYSLSLPGLRAAQNSLLAAHTFEQIGFIAEDHLIALEEIDWPARMSRLHVDGPCPVFLSGDHNKEGAQSLSTIAQEMNYETLYFIVGTSKNRNTNIITQELASLPRSQFVLTSPKFMGSSPKSATYTYIQDPLEALKVTCKRAGPKDLIIITGSLYLCGDILSSLHHK